MPSFDSILEVDIHFLQEKVHSGIITSYFVRSSAQTIDMLTKSIGPSLLQSYLVKLELVDIFVSAWGGVLKLED